MTWTATTVSALRRRGDDALLRCVCLPDSPAVISEHGWAVFHQWLPGWDMGGTAITAPGHASGAFAALCDADPAGADAVGWFSVLPGQRFDPGPRFEIVEEAGDGWAMMVATTTDDAALPAGCRLVELDDTADASRITAFNAAHNPHSEGAPGTGRTTLWLGVEEAGELLGVGAWQPLASGCPYFAGLVTHTRHRGRGIGRFLLAELTRRALAEHDECVLGVDGDNAGAIRLYERMGWRTVHAFASSDVRRVASAS